MPLLDQWAVDTFGKLGNEWQLLAAAGGGWPVPYALGGPGGQQVYACWNWALSGLGDICVDPARIFAYCSAVPTDPWINCPPELGNAWFNTRSNRKKLRRIRNAFALDADANRARLALIRLAIEANGLTIAPGATNYALKIYGTPNTPYPNWSHWWLDVYGATVEHFTNQPDMRIYTGGYAGGHALGGLQVDTIYLTGIHQRHKDRIQWTLRNRRNSIVLRHPGGRQAWIADNLRANCNLCHGQFTVFNRRHHCRCCGEIFCNTHSSKTCYVVSPATRPGSANLARSGGRVRVCDRCLPVP